MEQHEASSSHRWNWDGEETGDEWLIFLPKNCHQTLLHLQVGKDRILPKTPDLLKTLHGRVKGYRTPSGMKSRVSEALRLERGIPCKKDLTRAILSIVDERMLRFCPHKAAAVHRLYKDRLSTKGDFSLEKQLAEVNKPVLDLVRLGHMGLAKPTVERVSTNSEGWDDSNHTDPRNIEESADSQRGQTLLLAKQIKVPQAVVSKERSTPKRLKAALSLGGLALLAVGWYFYEKRDSSTASLAQNLKSDSTPAILTKPASPSTQVLLYLQAPESEYIRSTNRIWREYLRRQFESTGRSDVQIREQGPGAELSERTAESIRTTSQANSIVWLYTAEVPAGKRLYIRGLTPSGAVKPIDVDSSLSNQTLQSFTPIDQQGRGIYALVEMPVFDELEEAGDFSKLEGIIAKSYETDPVLKQLGVFDFYEARVLANHHDFWRAREKLAQIKLAPGDNPTSLNLLGHPRLVRDYQMAVVLYRLGRYEEAFSILAKGRIRGGKPELTILNPMLAYTSNGIVFLKLDYPEGMAIMVRHNARSLVILEGPYIKDFDDALTKGDDNHFFDGMARNLSKSMVRHVEPGVYLAKPDHEIIDGEYFTLHPKRLRDIQSNLTD
jgi:hypothetical protein